MYYFEFVWLLCLFFCKQCMIVNVFLLFVDVASLKNVCWYFYG